jgi:hypothetical protein
MSAKAGRFYLILSHLFRGWGGLETKLAALALVVLFSHSFPSREA